MVHVLEYPREQLARGEGFAALSFIFPTFLGDNHIPLVSRAAREASGALWQVFSMRVHITSKFRGTLCPSARCEGGLLRGVAVQTPLLV